MPRKPSKKQLAVLDDLFSSELTEQQILEKHSVSKTLFNRWRSDETFITEFDRRIELLNRNSKLLIAKYSSLVAAKLIALTESENQETARKACLDILSLTKTDEQKSKDEQKPNFADNDESPQMSPKLAEKILKSLTE